MRATAERETACGGGGVMVCGVTIPGGWEKAVTFARLLEKLHADKHTGPVVIHFAQGHPNGAEIPSAPTRIALDKGRKKSDP